jgi:hypothetical protein
MSEARSFFERLSLGMTAWDRRAHELAPKDEHS